MFLVYFLLVMLFADCVKHGVNVGALFLKFLRCVDERICLLSIGLCRPALLNPEHVDSKPKSTEMRLCRAPLIDWAPFGLPLRRNSATFTSAQLKIQMEWRTSTYANL